MGSHPPAEQNEPCTHRRLAFPDVTRAVNSDRAPSRHTHAFAYRCFLPDLTGFTKVRCARPGRQRHLLGAGSTKTKPRAGIRPRYSGLRVQGTATAPSSTATGLTKDVERTVPLQVSVRIFIINGCSVA